MKDKYQDLARELKKKKAEQECDVYTNRNWCFWYSLQRIDSKTGKFRNNETSGDHPNYCIIEIG